jgi:hypothetical protein
MNRILALSLSVATLAALAPVRAEAQASPFVGKWAVEITAGMLIENGEPTPIRAKATIAIVEAGDSLLATLDVEPNENVPPRPPARFAAAKIAGNTSTFIQRSEARINTNGEEQTMWMVSTWTLTVSGNAITGDVRREIEGGMGPGMPAQPVTGTRVP